MVRVMGLGFWDSGYGVRVIRIRVMELGLGLGWSGLGLLDSEAVEKVKYSLNNFVQRNC